MTRDELGRILMGMQTRAECTWGDGPDVLVVVGNDDLRWCWVSYNPDLSDEAGSFGLSAENARRLAAELVVAAERAEALERSLQESR